MSHDHGARCLCVSVHRPGVLEYEWHHILPLAMGGADTPHGRLGQNGVWLCPTAHTNVHEMLRYMLKHGPLTWGDVGAIWEEPNRYALRVAVDGYFRFKTQAVDHLTDS